MANKHMIKCSTSLVNREVQIKSIIYHHISTKLPKFKKYIHHQILVKIQSNRNSNTAKGKKIVRPL